MEITIHLDSILKIYSKSHEGKIKLAVEEGTTIGQALEKTGIIGDAIGLIVLNSKIVQEDTVLSTGDVVRVYPIMGGG